MSVRTIAHLAGISPSAVSLALRNSPKVSAAVRHRVVAIADRLAYRPDGRVAELMSCLRAGRERKSQGCFAVMSLYEQARPWDSSRHLSLIFASMGQHAGKLGYRLEPLWLRAPGMSRRRFRNILDARGIEGMLCFGSPEPQADFPSELESYATVTVGLSIRTPMHRVISHVYNDTRLTLQKVHALGYRRPGLIVGSEDRDALAYSSAYLGWCERELGPGGGLPILRLARLDPRAVMDWLGAYRPDVVVFVDGGAKLRELSRVLRDQGIDVPGQLGVAAVSHLLADSGFSGVQQNQTLMGAWAVELLVARIMHRDFGVPAHPRIEMVEGTWVPGNSLRELGRSPSHRRAAERSAG
jgi:DNA-binding LacI/PurR family transcriptional regulator